MGSVLIRNKVLMVEIGNLFNRVLGSGWDRLNGRNDI